MNRYIEAFRALELADPSAYIKTYAPDMRSMDIVLRCVAHGERQSDIARSYGLSPNRIHQILNMTLRKLIWLHKRGER